VWVIGGSYYKFSPPPGPVRMTTSGPFLNLVKLRRSLNFDLEILAEHLVPSYSKHSVGLKSSSSSPDSFCQGKRKESGYRKRGPPGLTEFFNLFKDRMSESLAERQNPQAITYSAAVPRRAAIRGRKLSIAACNHFF
jgi:hypothetical protein